MIFIVGLKHLKNTLKNIYKDKIPLLHAFIEKLTKEDFIKMFRLIGGIENPSQPYIKNDFIINLNLHTLDDDKGLAEQKLILFFEALKSYKHYLNTKKLIDPIVSQPP